MHLPGLASELTNLPVWPYCSLLKFRVKIRKLVQSWSPMTAKSFCVLFTSLICLLAGCAEGPLWKTGHWNPMARDKWLAEEQIADTLFVRKREMNSLAEVAKTGSASAKANAVEKLKQTVRRDPVLLMRLHAVRLLGEIQSPESVAALRDAGKDPDAEVRIAAVKSWQSMGGDAAIAELQGIILADTNFDVRMAATRALGSFTGAKAARALSHSLTDRNPALQLRATESLARVTGEDFGPNVADWQNYIGQVAAPTRMAEQTTNDTLNR